MLSLLDTRLGHWSDPAARTGCTVVLFPQHTTASAEVRGGAPASRELALLSPQRTVNHIDAAVLTGGSAFGLAAADGVMQYCEENGRGVATPGGAVPIVPALGLFDLAVGDATVRPNRDNGYAACQAASTAPKSGTVGAGCGATVGAISGAPSAGGVAINSVQRGELLVTAIVAVNSFGVVDVDGSAAEQIAEFAQPQGLTSTAPFSNTTIGVVVTNAQLTKLECQLVAQGAHGGISRAIAPAHTRFDGDAFISAATGTVAADVDVVRLLATTTVAAAIRSLA